MCKYYQISLFFIICVLCALSRSDVVQDQRPFEQKRSGVSYILAGNYTFQNKDNKAAGNDVARIFVPPPSFNGRRISPLPGSEGSSQLAPKVQCSKYLDEIEKLKKTLQEQIESSKKVAHTTDRPKKQSAKKVPAKASKKSTSAKSSQKDVYFNSRKTYDEMMKLFNKTTLAGVDPKIRANADYYLHHLKMNLLVLTSNIQDYSKIKTCFSNFLSRTQQLRDYMSYHYDSCKGHYEQTCNSNTLVSYQDGLNELEYMTAECIRQRIN